MAIETDETFWSHLSLCPGPSLSLFPSEPGLVCGVAHFLTDPLYFGMLRKSRDKAGGWIFGHILLSVAPLRILASVAVVYVDRRPPLFACTTVSSTESRLASPLPVLASELLVCIAPYHATFSHTIASSTKQ